MSSLIGGPGTAAADYEFPHSLKNNSEDEFGFETGPSDVDAFLESLLGSSTNEPRLRMPDYVSDLLKSSKLHNFHIYNIAAHGSLVSDLFTSNLGDVAYLQVGGGPFAGCLVSSAADKMIKDNFSTPERIYNSFRVLLGLQTPYSNHLLNNCHYAVSGVYDLHKIKTTTMEGLPAADAFNDKGCEYIPDRFLSLTDIEIGYIYTTRRMPHYFEKEKNIHWGVYKLNHTTHEFDREDSYDETLKAGCLFSQLTYNIQQTNGFSGHHLFILTSCASQTDFPNNNYVGAKNKSSKVATLESKYGRMLSLLGKHNFFYVGNASDMPPLGPTLNTPKPFYIQRPSFARGRAITHNIKRAWRKSPLGRAATRNMKKIWRKTKRLQRKRELQTRERSKKPSGGAGGNESN